MADEETQTQTDEATQDGAETDANADTKDAGKTETTLTQAEVDRRTSAGIKAYIERIETEAEETRKNDEKIAAIKDGKFEEALKMTQAKLDAMEASQGAKDFKLEATSVLVELGMAKYAQALIPNAKTIEDLLQASQLLKADIEAGIEQGVNERLNTGPSRTPDNTHKTPDKTPDKMNKDEFLEWKRERKLV
jgi:hypothetical protein